MSETNDPTKEKYDNLINELIKNRGDMKSILNNIQQIRHKLNVFSPDENDFRIRNKAQEKLKAATEIIKAELDILKSIDNSVIKEVELRKKLDEQLNKTNDEFNIDKIFKYNDIKHLAHKIEDIQKNIEEGINI